jgi:hypothetical protein
MVSPTDEQIWVAFEALVLGGVVSAGCPATSTGRWEATCGCVHWFEAGHATPTQCPDCQSPVGRWDSVD